MTAIENVLTPGIFDGKMTGVFARLLRRPRSSCFLFGPRGTGKSTWIAHHFAGARLYDLLNTTEALRLAREPATLFREVEGLSAGDWVVIDEVQRVPELLDEVHRLIETRRLRFVLSGSSARKLRRGGANLLAGRAVVHHLFPLVSAERSFRVDFDDALRHGALPLAVTGDDPAAYLSAYAETYLQEEIRAEALTRSVGSFNRFLEIAARQNGQVTNVSSISRDAAVSRSTVRNYFEILIDTLIGNWLPAWTLTEAQARDQTGRAPQVLPVRLRGGARPVRPNRLSAVPGGARRSAGDVAAG